MNRRRRFVLLAGVMSLVTVVAVAATSALLYRVTIRTQRQDLLNLATDRASLVATIAGRFDDSGELLAAVAQACREAPVLGETGEVTVARRVGDRMCWVIPTRFPAPVTPLCLPLEGALAEPMQRALAGDNETVVARDYRGQRVLAGFALAEPPGWAVVAKMDLAEVRAPFWHAGLLVAGLTLVLVAVGAGLYLRGTAPVLAELEQSAGQLQRVLENMLHGFQIVDEKWRYVYLNPAAANHGRRDRAELIGRPMQEVYPGIEQTEMFAVLEDCMRRRVSRRLENLFEYEDGSRAWFELRVEPAPGGLLIQSVDVTGLKLAEEASRDSEARLRALFESSVVGILFGDIHGNISEANEELLRIVGYSREDLAAGRLRWLDITPPEFLPLDQAGIAEAAEHGACAPYEKQYIRQDGSRIWVLVGYVLVGERRESSVAFVLDISDRKRAEAELRRHRDHLEELVAERTAALSAANRELEAFSYSVSHDLRAPLRSIDGFAQALAEDAADRLDETTRRHLERVRANAQKMGDLIDALLKLSRVSRAELRRERVDLAELAAEVAEELREAAPERDVELVIARPLEARADPRLLRVVLVNLLGNAWKFTAGHRTAHVEVGSVAVEGATAYFVKDDGFGFDMAYVDKLFGAFQRLHSSREFEGAGIGLATVQRIVHRHGGRTWAEGAVDRGATFFFTLESGRPDGGRAGEAA